MFISYRPITIYYDPRTGKPIKSIVGMKVTKDNPVRAHVIHPDFNGKEKARYAVDGRIILELPGNSKFKREAKISTYQVITRPSGVRNIKPHKEQTFEEKDFDIQLMTDEEATKLLNLNPLSGTTD